MGIQKQALMKIFKSIFDKPTWLSALVATIIWGIFWILAATIFFFVITHPGWLKRMCHT
jgi:hypothetical protein